MKLNIEDDKKQVRLSKHQVPYENSLVVNNDVESLLLYYLQGESLINIS